MATTYPYAPLATDSLGDAFAGRTVNDWKNYAAHDPLRQTAQFLWKPVQDELLALIRAGVSNRTYRITWTCDAGLAVGDPVYISSNTTVTKSAANLAASAKIVGFCRYKPTSTTCFLDHFRYVYGLSGGTAGALVYLSNTGTYSAAAGTIPVVAGVWISTAEAWLSATSWTMDASLLYMTLATAQTVSGVKTFNTGTLRLLNPANTQYVQITPGAQLGDRTLYLPVIGLDGGDDTLMTLRTDQDIPSMTYGRKTFAAGKLRLFDSDESHRISIQTSNETADRDLYVPVLGTTKYIVVTSETDGQIVNADIDAAAAIAPTKLLRPYGYALLRDTRAFGIEGGRAKMTDGATEAFTARVLNEELDDTGDMGTLLFTPPTPHATLAQHTSDGTNAVIKTTAAHTLLVGESVILRGWTWAGGEDNYRGINCAYTITAVTSDTFTIQPYRTSGTNPTVVGTIELGKFSLAAGTYEIDALVPAFECNQHQAKLVSIASGVETDEIRGTTECCNSGVYVTTYSRIKGRFTFSGTGVLEIKHMVTYVNAGTPNTSTFGKPKYYGAGNEHYTTVELRRVGA